MSNIQIKTRESKFPTAENLYGLFFEDINRSGDSGLYPEMLRNRAFEDSILPEGCTPVNGSYGFETPTGWRDEFNNGEGLSRWLDGVEPTDVPAWYTKNARMQLELKDTLNANRKAALLVTFEEGTCIYNVGFCGIPVEEGKGYDFYMFAKAAQDLSLTLILADESGEVLAQTAIDLKTSDSFIRYDASFAAVKTSYNSKFIIKAEAAGIVLFGFTSLMPQETYKGHGLRKDLMEMLEGTHSKFLRFPGGCIVEGFTRETMMRFPKTIGPVWERPSHVLMWHYRTTNGLGYHEYLQFCEDMNLEPMYVINCGLTCQARFVDYIVDEELEELLQEAYDAIDYATASADSNKWGALRAQNGHPEPFGMKYVEIGNENEGPEYLWRYRKFYDALKERYPDIIFIANIHTEKDGHPTEVVDEHYYSTPEFFQENQNMFDSYDRQGPEIFIGEYAVTSGKHIGDLYAALAEAMYLTGIENNQDIVTLTSYAPLLQNVDYTAWYPDLIAFNNHEVVGIPLYYVIQMMAAHRGKEVLNTVLDGRSMYTQNVGIPGIITFSDGVSLKNVTYNGQPAAITHQLAGEYTQNADEIHLFPGTNRELETFPAVDEKNKKICYLTFGEEENTHIVWEADIKLDSKDTGFGITLWNAYCPMLYKPDETSASASDWSPVFTEHFSWNVQEGKGTGCSVHWLQDTPIADSAKLPLLYGEYMHIKVDASPEKIDCYINGELTQTIPMQLHPCTAVTASADEETVYVKIVNLSAEADAMSIQLDCDVESAYEAVVLTGDSANARNDFANPRAVSPVVIAKEGAGRDFVFDAAPLSLNILKLKKA